MAKKEPIDWITVNGKHIPIFEGESKQDAYNRAVAKDNEDKKQKQIAENKVKADKLNGKDKDTKSKTGEWEQVDDDTFKLVTSKSKSDIIIWNSHGDWIINKDKKYGGRAKSLEEAKALALKVKANKYRYFGVDKVAKATQKLSGKFWMPIYYSDEDNTVYLKDGEGRKLVGHALNPNTPEDIEKLVYKYLWR